MASRPNANPTHKTISFSLEKHFVKYEIMIYINKELVSLECNIKHIPKQ